MTITGTIAATLAIASLGAHPSVSHQITPITDVPAHDSAFLKGHVHIGPADAWAVGYYRPPSGTNDRSLTLAYHWDGSAWTRVTTPNPTSSSGITNVIVEDVDASATDAVFGVGSYIRTGATTPDTFLMEWDGSSWSHVITPGQSSFGSQGFLFECAHVDATGAAHFGGQFQNPPTGHSTATIIEYDNGGFQRTDGPLLVNGAHRIRDIDSSSPSNAWGVGAGGGTSTAIGRVYALHFDGSSWQENSPPQTGTGEVLRACAVIAPDDVWAAGSYQGFQGFEPLFWHWDGSSWTSHPSPGFCSAMVALASDDVYAISGGVLLHYDGTDWAVVADITGTGAPQPAIRALSVTGPDELTGVGETDRGRDLASVTFTISRACQGDADANGVTDINDISFVIFRLGNSGAPGAVEGDADGNGVVDVNDISFVVFRLGPCA